MDASLFYTKSIACVTGKVKDVSKVAGEYHYYTLSMHMKDKMVSCPVMNAEGRIWYCAEIIRYRYGDYLLCGGSSFCHVAENQCSFFGRRCLEKHWYPERFTLKRKIGALVYLFIASSEPLGRGL